LVAAQSAGDDDAASEAEARFAPLSQQERVLTEEASRAEEEASSAAEKASSAAGRLFKAERALDRWYRARNNERGD
jgi:hypothetical protein